MFKMFLIIALVSTFSACSSGGGDSAPSNSTPAANVSIETATYGFSLRELGFTEKYMGSGLGHKDNIYMVSSSFGTLTNSANFKITGVSTEGNLTGVFKIYSYENRSLLFSFDVTLIKDSIQNKWQQIIKDNGIDKYELILTFNNTDVVNLFITPQLSRFFHFC